LTRLKTTGLCPQLHDRQVTGVVDVDGCLGKFVGCFEQFLLLGPVFRKEAVTQKFHVHPGAGAQHTQGKLGRTHFERENQDGHSLAPSRQRGGFGEIQGQRGFAHRGTGREDDHFLALKSVGVGIKIFEARRHAREFAFFHHHLRDDSHRLAGRSLHLHRTVRHAVLGDLEDVLLHLVDELLESAIVGVATLDRSRGHLDQLAQQVQLANFLDEVIRLRRRRNAAADLGEVGVAADFVELTAGFEFFGEDLKIDRHAFVVELDQPLKNHPVGRSIKSGRTQLAFEAARHDVGSVKKAARQQILLGLDAVRRNTSDHGLQIARLIRFATGAAGRFLEVVSHEGEQRGKSLPREKQW